MAKKTNSKSKAAGRGQARAKTRTAKTPAAETRSAVSDSQIVKRQVVAMVGVLALVLGAWWLWHWGEATGWGNPDRAVQLRLERAQQAVVGRALNQAADIYEDLLQRYPDHPDAVQAMTQLAGTYHELKDYPAAIAAYQRLLQKLQGNESKKDLRAFTLLQIAKLHREQGNADQALQTLGEVRSNYPGTDWSGEAQSEIGGVYQDRGQYKDAIGAYHGVIRELAGGFLAAEAQGKIGECYELLGDLDRAIDEYQKVLDEYPSAVWDPAKARIDALKKKLASQKKTPGEAG